MPRYFISLIDGDVMDDEDGREVPDLEGARRLALKAAGEIVADEMAQGRENIRLTLIVEDEARERLLELPVVVTAG
ncbi:MAG TPA: hypothetical protein VK472_01440 [Allosphingosinicella sp.]|nr:hypothetical protein [Allosphingosinicella sp.]